MKSIVNKISLTLLGFLVASSLDAFDNNRREGFFLSLGAGISQTSYEPYRHSNSKTGFGTSQKIGYGLTNQFIVHLSREDSWFKKDNDLHMSCIPGIGATYYFSEEAKSIFVSGTLGAGTFNNVDEKDENFGAGLSLTLGYEIVQHFNTELTFMAADIDIDDEKVNPAIFKLGVSYSWY
ncbi:MAG: hypothetical protein U9Q40_02380 [Campylobacterota bacterium]|nr:hypothetical protein [Campylobacterota bacterium]